MGIVGEGTTAISVLEGEGNLQMKHATATSNVLQWVGASSYTWSTLTCELRRQAIFRLFSTGWFDRVKSCGASCTSACTAGRRR